MVVNYILSGVSKGVFEDCPEFWEGISDIDEAYGPYRNATEKFVDELRKAWVDLVKPFCLGKFFQVSRNGMAHECDGQHTNFLNLENRFDSCMGY